MTTTTTTNLFEFTGFSTTLCGHPCPHDRQTNGRQESFYSPLTSVRILILESHGTSPPPSHTRTQCLTTGRQSQTPDPTWFLLTTDMTGKMVKSTADSHVGEAFLPDTPISTAPMELQVLVAPSLSLSPGNHHGEEESSMTVQSPNTGDRQQKNKARSPDGNRSSDDFHPLCYEVASLQTGKTTYLPVHITLHHC